MSPKAILLALASLFSFLPPVTAQTGFIGEVRLFAGNYAPRNWAFCDGQMLPIRDNEALYSIIGTTYGGDGRTSFALPKLTAPGQQSQASLPTIPTTLPSRPGGSPLTATFKNRTQMTLSAEWVSWDGELVKYADIPPGGEWTVNSGAQQYWRFSHGTQHVQDIELVGNQSEYNIMPATGSMSNSTSNGPHYIICLRGVFPARN